MAGILEKRNSMYRQLEEHSKTCDELQQQIDNMQALANIGVLSSMMAHEIKNILTPLGSFAQLALKYPEDTALANKALEKTVAHSARADKILTSVLDMAKGKCKQKNDCDLKEMIDEVFYCIAREFSKDGIKVNLDIEENFKLNVEPVSFQQVLMNLIMNARQAMIKRGGTLTIAASTTDEQIRIDISDTGQGIEADILGQIFEPFFTTKGRGTGLGLAFSKRVVQSHDGFICVNSEQNVGTTFSIILPSNNSNQTDPVI